MVEVQPFTLVTRHDAERHNAQHVAAMNDDNAGGNKPGFVFPRAGIGEDEQGEQHEQRNAVAGIANPHTGAAVDTDGALDRIGVNKRFVAEEIE